MGITLGIMSRNGGNSVNLPLTAQVSTAVLRCQLLHSSCTARATETGAQEEWGLKLGTAHGALITLKVRMLSYGTGDLQYLSELPVWGEWLKLSWEVG